MTYILLVGNARDNTMPSNMLHHPYDPSFVFFPSNNYYGNIVSSNSFNDIIIGRFQAVDVYQVKTQIVRTIYYERDLTQNDNCLNNELGTTGRHPYEATGHFDEFDDIHMDFISDTL